jgi:hypothetical protein
LLRLIVFVHVVNTVVDLVVDKIGLAAIASAGFEMVASGSGLKDVQKQKRCRDLVRKKRKGDGGAGVLVFWLLWRLSPE